MGSRYLRTFWIVVVVLTALLTVSSFTVLGQRINTLIQRQTLEQARSYADLVIAARAWNASHGGVYIKLSNHAFTNPYLRDLGVEPDDVLQRQGVPVTLRNPSAMTRELGEMLPRVGDDPAFRLTSTHPVNPNNAPDQWEREALAAFETGVAERSGPITTDDGVAAFRYAVPLTVEKDCLTCHSDGYRVGDVRGALVVTLPYKSTLDAMASNRRELTLAAVTSILSVLVIVAAWALWLENRLTKSAEQLAHMANTDALTGLMSRRATLTTLEQELERAGRSGDSAGILMIDIDHFKRFNDTYGHAVGDEVLRRTADMLRDSVRQYDSVGRMGGEELLVIAPGIDTSSIGQLAERIRAAAEAIDLSDICGGCDESLTLSIGTALSRAEQGENVDELIARADGAMYTAKENGRNRVVACGA